MGELQKRDQDQASGRFSAEEPSSFCSRETPVAPIPMESLLQAIRAGSPAEEAPADDQSDEREQNGRSGSGPAASVDPAPSVPAPSPSSRATEQDFWDKPPAYSLAPRSLWPRSLWPQSLRPKPSPKRSWLAWLLFVAIFVPVLLLFAHMLSIRYGIPWLDVPALMR